MHDAKFLDWLGMLSLVIMFGSAFLFTKLAVQEFPPSLVTAGRIIIAALVLLIFSLARKESFGFLYKHWFLLVALAFFGDCLPFYLISWGQQSVDSSIAGILMAVMPLTTIVLAHFFVQGEPLTINRVVGFFLGFVGVLVLLGPAALAKLESGEDMLFAMLAILGGAVSYAVNTVLAKRLPNGSFLAISTAVLIVASAMMLPMLFTANYGWEIEITSIESFSLILLGIFPTAIATIIYFAVIARVGPSFLSQINYLIPIWAILMGIVFLNESIGINAFIALVIILLGIAIAQRQKMSFARF